MALKLLPNERELLAKIAFGDHRAFRVVYDSYARKVYTQAVQLLHSDVEAEEMTQEIFLKLWLLGERVYEINNLEAYLRTLTRNRALNVLRKMVLEGRIEKALGVDWKEESNEAEEEILIKDVRNMLNKAVEMLPQQQKQVYQLCHQEGLRYEEAAERLNLSPLTVQVHMKRALKSVRAYVKANTDVAIILMILKLL